MKDELNRKIRELCDEAGSASAAAMAPRLMTDLDGEYDKRVQAGMSELDAYRDVLRSVDRIRAMLSALPKDTPSPRSSAKSNPGGPARSGGSDGFGAEEDGTGDGWDPEEDYSRRAAGMKQLKFYVEKASSLLWGGTTLVYVLWSLAFGGWRYTWLIFLWAAAGQVVLSAAEDYNKRLNLKKTLFDTFSGCLWIEAVIFFFLAGFGLGLWRFSWLIFLAATIMQILLGAVLGDGK